MKRLKISGDSSSAPSRTKCTCAPSSLYFSAPLPTACATQAMKAEAAGLGVLPARVGWRRLRSLGRSGVPSSGVVVAIAASTSAMARSSGASRSSALSVHN